MFHRIRQYDLIEADGRFYRPRAYADPRPDDMWDGWLVFFPIGGGPAVAPDRDTTASTFRDLTIWADGVMPTHLEAALERALEINEYPLVLSRLAQAEYEALEDAERLRTAAEIDRITAKLDDVAARDARVEADEIRRHRLAAERALAATDEAVANAEAHRHEAAAKSARAEAADASRRRRSAAAAATSGKPARRRKRTT